MNATTTHKANVGATNASAFKLHSTTMLVARVLLVAIFILSGLSKLGAIQPTMGYMQATGVPGALIYPTIAFEIAGRRVDSDRPEGSHRQRCCWPDLAS